MKHESAFGKNNFDRLEAAGLVGTTEDAGAAKAAIQKRITELTELSAKFDKVELALSRLYVLAKHAQLKKLTAVSDALKKLRDTKLPVGTKQLVDASLNEVTSLREGVFLGAATDKKTLTILACDTARRRVAELVVAAEARLNRMQAESATQDDLEEFYRKAAAVITKHSGEKDKLGQIGDKPFVIARVPVVPIGGYIPIDKLRANGFDVDELSGYVVMRNQIVVGLNPKALLGDHPSAVKSDKVKTAVRDEVDKLRKNLQKTMKVRLQYVADRPFSYKNGVWFWLMPDKELDRLAKTFPGGHAKIERWGFAFN